jgi:branched-chain amino acid transport system substrate-binding protein
MGAEFAEGHITAAPYFQTVDTDTNRRTLAAYRARNGSEHPANQCWEAAYFQMHLLVDALRRADPDDVESVRRALPGTEVDAPQGRVRIDEENHHTHLRPRIGRVDATGRFEILEEARERVRPDPYLVSHTLDDWSVRTALRATV